MLFLLVVFHLQVSLLIEAISNQDGVVKKPVKAGGINLTVACSSITPLKKKQKTLFYLECLDLNIFPTSQPYIDVSGKRGTFISPGCLRSKGFGLYQSFFPLYDFGSFVKKQMCGSIS